MENTITVSLNDIKKDLYKSKATAQFSHYCAGSLYYNIELTTGEKFQFNIKTTENVPLILSFENDPGEVMVNDQIYTDKTTILNLSSDLAITPFNAEIKASELNRWIAKCYESGDLVKIN